MLTEPHRRSSPPRSGGGGTRASSGEYFKFATWYVRTRVLLLQRIRELGVKSGRYACFVSAVEFQRCKYKYTYKIYFATRVKPHGAQVGNLGAYFVFQAWSRAALFVFFVVLAGAGTAMLVFLRPARAPAAGAAAARDAGPVARVLAGFAEPNSDIAVRLLLPEAEKGSDDDSPLGLAAAGLAHLRDVKLQLLCAMFWFSGYELAFWTGTQDDS